MIVSMFSVQKVKDNPALSTLSCVLFKKTWAEFCGSSSVSEDGHKGHFSPLMRNQEGSESRERRLIVFLLLVFFLNWFD